MDKIRLGKTGMMVSRIGFGGIPIQRVTEDEAISIVRKCLDLGVNYIDTANRYTNSEERIGKAIIGRRDGLIIATKSGSRDLDEVKSHLQQSLSKLGVEYIDLYQIHNVSDFDTLNMITAPGGVLSILQEAKAAGLIKHIGISSHQLEVAKEAVKTDCFESIMFPFNFIAKEAADELLPLAREHDVGFIAMKPLGGGMLDNATLTFKYLFQFPDVMPIPGIQKIAEIEEIVQLLDGPLQLTEAELAEMQKLRDELGNRFCRRCDYCQPCSAEIPISTVMLLPCFLKSSNPETTFSDAFANEVEKADNCVDCGDCEERCPYNLPIREIIAEHINRYEKEKKEYQEKIAQI
ncbi:aldo/keto reductase [Chloroflexota bacterium]